MYLEPEKHLPLYDNVDVLVAGAGTAGFAAATAAARNGAKTLLIERGGVIGGVMTASLDGGWGVHSRFWDGLGEQVVTGIPWELHRRVIEAGGGPRSALHIDTAPTKAMFDLEVFKRVALEMLVESNVQILFHTFVVDVIAESKTIKGVIIENKSGRQAIFAKQIIDATGDGDLCVGMGVGHTNCPREHTSVFSVGGVDIQQTFEYIKKHKDQWLNSERVQKEGLDKIWDAFEREWDRGYLNLATLGIDDLYHMEPMRPIFEKAIADGYFEKNNFLKYSEALTGTESTLEWSFDMQGIFAWRESSIVCSMGIIAIFDGTDAKLVSHYEVLGIEKAWKLFEHILKKFPGFEKSFIVQTPTDIGIRRTRIIDTDYTLTGQQAMEGVAFDDVIGRYSIAKENIPRGFDIPFRQILPVGAHNLYVVGKPHGAGKHLRAMPPCMIGGQAAGTAAALAAHQNLSSREINIKQLQNTLLDSDVNLGIQKHK